MRAGSAALKFYAKIVGVCVCVEESDKFRSHSDEEYTIWYTRARVWIFLSVVMSIIRVILCFCTVWEEFFFQAQGFGSECVKFDGNFKNRALKKKKPFRGSEYIFNHRFDALGKFCDLISRMKFFSYLFSFVQVQVTAKIYFIPFFTIFV